MKSSFEKLEEFLKNSPPRHKAIIYTLSFLLIIAVFLKYILPPLKDKEENLRYEIESLEQSLTQENPNALNRKLNTLKKELLEKKSEVNDLKENLNLIESKLYALPYLYKEEKFAKALDRVLKNSIKENLKIAYIKKVAKDENQTVNFYGIKEMKRMEIKGRGQFKNIINFINSIEEVNILSDINDIDLKKAKDSVEFSFVWILYGIKL
ncbi:MAG: hypothetical protein GXO31_02040 [Epsilonproteobacteria bacterium]|nr:hypothetical protein [Campylobacterota bacterium]